MAQISRPFQNAVKAMVQARVPAWQYHFGGVQVPSEQLEYPYLVQWPVPATGLIANLAGNLIPAVNDARFVACGRDIDEVLWGLDEVAAALIGQRPDIEGWACGFIRALPGETAPVAENKDILFDGRPTYMSWAHYRMTAEPAPVTAS
jgi:hypothetical protein